MRLLVVGLGSVGQRHVRCLRELYGNDVQLIAFRQKRLNREITPDLQARENVSLEALYNIKSYDRLEDALAQQPAAALVCTPNHLHLEWAQQLADAGVHLFIEKPVSHNLVGIERLQQTVSDKRLICMVGYQLRFHPGIAQMEKLLREQTLGTIIGAHFDFGEYMPYWHRYEDYAMTFHARRAEGGGVTLTQIHDIDIVLAMFGLPQSVYCVGGNSGTLEIDAEDHASSLLTYGGNGGSFAVALTHDCLRYPPRRTYAIDGTNGSLRFDAYANTLQWTPFDGVPETVYEDPTFPRQGLFLSQMKHFIQCLRGERQPRVDLHTGVESLRIALAIKESMKCNQQIAL